MKLLALLLLLSLACEPRPPARTTTIEPPPGWWRATCGDITPVGVMGGHDLTPPQLVTRVEPRWPKREPRGIIILATVITAEGHVCAAHVVRGLDPELDRAAQAAVRQWRFTPVRIGGRARAAFYNVTVPVE